MYYDEEIRDLEFSQWRKDNDYPSYEDYVNDQLLEGKDADDIRREYRAEYIDKFLEYCDEEGIEPLMDEE